MSENQEQSASVSPEEPLGLREDVHLLLDTVCYALSQTHGLSVMAKTEGRSTKGRHTASAGIRIGTRTYLIHIEPAE